MTDSDFKNIEDIQRILKYLDQVSLIRLAECFTIKRQSK